MKKLLIGILLVCLAGGLVIPACAPAPEEEPVESIKIGVIGPMAFLQGEHNWYGAVIAAEEINEAGGVSVAGVQRPIELLQIDSNELVSVSDATLAVEKAITTDKVDFLVGGYRSEAALAMHDIAAGYHKIFLSPPCGHPDIVKRIKENYEKYKYIFRVGGGSTAGMNMLANITPLVGAKIREELGIDKVKVALLAVKVIWPTPFIITLKSNAEAWGMEVIGDWRPSATATDLTAELTAIKAAGAHLIFPCLGGPVNVVFGKQMGDLEIPAATMGWQVETSSISYWEATGGKANYEATASLYARVPATDKSLPFYDRFIELSGGDSPTQSAATYSAVWALKLAIEQAGTLDSDAVVAALEEVDFLGPEGRISFTGMDTDEPHDQVWGAGYATGFGVQWQDGELVPFWPPADGSFEGVVYEGIKDYKLSPTMLEYWKGK